MKNNIVKIICALSLLACTIAKADEPTTSKTCIINDARASCSVNISKNQETFSIIFPQFTITSIDQAVACDFDDRNVEFDYISSVTGDFLSAVVTHGSKGRVTATFRPSLSGNVQGTIDINVKNQRGLIHHINILSCHGQSRFN